MKQRITKKQLDELSTEMYGKLYLWFYKDKTTFPSTTPREEPLLTIGEMIEYLGDKWIFNIIELNNVFTTIEWVKNKNLCNQLWEDLKKINK